MKNLLRPIFLFLLLLIGLVRCAATPNITRHPTQAQAIPAPNPEALAHFIDAKLLEMHGQREEAVRALITAIAHDSTSATLYSALARNLVALQHFEYAQEPARKSIGLDSSDVSSRWLLFHALMGSRQDTTAAIQQLETIIDINPRELEALDTLLKVYRLQDRKKDVLRILKSLAAVPNLNTRYRVFIAESFTRYEAPADAVKLYQQILEDDPTQSEIWSRLGELTLATGDTLGAAQALRRGLTHVDNRVDRSTRRAWQLLVQIYATDAHLDSLLAEKPPDVRFLEHMADIYAVVAQNSTGNDTSAVRHARYAEALLNALVQAAPNQPDLYYKKGNLLLSENRLEEAQAAFNQAIAIEPSARYWLGMSHIYLRQQQWDRAIEILTTLFTQAPEKSGLYTQIVFDLGRAYTVTGQFEKSRQVYRQAAQADSSQMRFHLEMGRTYVFQKDWKNAIAVFEQLVKQTDDNADLLKPALYELGHSYERDGQFDNGVKVFQRLLALDPDHHQ
ncbi:MAG: tetratricopeptide repeat protein, partial [bacterium]|nr:tetratricopeptide repeat protein [bacterium]